LNFFDSNGATIGVFSTTIDVLEPVTVNVNEKVYRLTLNFFTTLAVNLFTSSEVLTFN